MKTKLDSTCNKSLLLDLESNGLWAKSPRVSKLYYGIRELRSRSLNIREIITMYIGEAEYLHYIYQNYAYTRFLAEE